MFLLRLVTQDNGCAIALVCGLLSSLMPWTFYRAGREAGIAKTRALGLWAVMVWLPSLLQIYQFFMMETLLLPLIGLGLWMSLRHLRKGNLGSFLAATTCWTAACLTKTVPFPLAAVCLLYGWWTRSRKLSHALAALTVFVLMLIPNTVRSQRILGFAAPFGNTWLPRIHHRAGTKYLHLKNGQANTFFCSPSSQSQPLAPFCPWVIERSYDTNAVLVPISPRRGLEDWRGVFDRLEVIWRDWFVRWGENIMLFFFAPPWPDCAGGARIFNWLNYWQRWIWAPIVFYVMDANLAEFRRRRFFLIPVGTTIFLLWLGLQNLVIMEGRFRKPIEPVLLLNMAWIGRRKDEISQEKQANVTIRKTSENLIAKSIAP
ncbi:MAG: glycosyltransferase family 39 protein [Verrucomicrobiae bacterium]|nr:glycosyltransferase family 39 protein [Verrucomicrobiae bacterium]